MGAPTESTTDGRARTWLAQQRTHGPLLRVGLADPVVRLVAALLVVDLAFVVVVGLMYIEVLPLDPRLELGTDRGFPELWGYAKVVATLGVLVVAARRRAPLTRRALAGVFLLILADDALRLHEDLGRELAEAVGLPAVLGLRAKDLGELAVYGAVVTMALVLLLVASRSAPTPRDRAFVDLLVAGFVVLAGLGIGVDLVDQVVAFTGAWAVEDGGELAMMSLLLGLVLLGVRDGVS